MDNNRPRGRVRNVTGTGRAIKKRGPGLGSGPVGDAGGYAERRQASGGQERTSTRAVRSGGGLKTIIIAVAILLLGGGGGLTALLGGGQAPGQQTQQPSGSSSLAQLLGGIGGGAVSSGWDGQANTGRLDTSDLPGTRERYTALLGGGEDNAVIMVYMCGTDLESRSGMATSDIQEMLAADLGDKVDLLLFTGGCAAWKNDLVSRDVNQIWQVKDGGLTCLESDMGRASMTDPDTLTRYISWCAGRYPASRYGLILWDHGGGSVSGYGYDEKYTSSGSMDLAELDGALKAAGVKFDFIGFDACLMATVETALTMARHADYMIASEETEPGVGWYYTDWLTALGRDTSMPTVELGRLIVDDFVDTCAQKCPGQQTTLSVVDLAELELTVPEAFAGFSRSTSELIRRQEYAAVSDARSDSREFAASNRIDQVDLAHLAMNMGTAEGEALVRAVLGAVKYNRTSSNMTNAYGLSVYFPYRRTSTVTTAVSTFEEIGMDRSYVSCIRQFADVAAGGQAASGASGSPLPSLLGSVDGGGIADLASVLQSVLGGRSIDMENAQEYLETHRFASENLKWTDGGDGKPVLSLPEDQWALVQELELNMFYDDGEGYIDLGLDNVFEFDGSGRLLGENPGTWVAIEGQPVAYYHTSTVDDGETLSVTGRVPALVNGVRSELLLTFDSAGGRVTGVRTVYTGGETETVAKSAAGLEPGDTVEFLCDYYSYSGEYEDSYLLGDPITVPDRGLAVSDVYVQGDTVASYRFTDIYGQHYWTPPC